jgi:hypothetical protein
VTGSKQFFFEKKNQKIFTTSPASRRPQILPSRALAEPGAAVGPASEQKFFASFYQKRRPSLL